MLPYTFICSSDGQPVSTATFQFWDDLAAFQWGEILAEHADVEIQRDGQFLARVSKGPGGGRASEQDGRSTNRA
jgi:hypothetical protein